MVSSLCPFSLPLCFSLSISISVSLSLRLCLPPHTHTPHHPCPHINNRHMQFYLAFLTTALNFQSPLAAKEAVCSCMVNNIPFSFVSGPLNRGPENGFVTSKNLDPSEHMCLFMMLSHFTARCVHPQSKRCLKL